MSGHAAGAPPAAVQAAITAPEAYCRDVGQAGLLSGISAQERARAERFHFDEDRISYLAAHHLMRKMLAEELGTSPAQIELSQAAGGKPELRGPEAGLSFNLSHTRGMVACALARDALVGIDVERHRPVPDVESVARSILTAAELETMHGTPAEQRGLVFLRWWTAKEAYAKAVGKGLALPLTSVEVRHAGDGEPPVILDARTGEPLPGVRLRFCDAGPEHLAALAVVTAEDRDG